LAENDKGQAKKDDAATSVPNPAPTTHPKLVPSEGAQPPTRPQRADRRRQDEQGKTRRLAWPLTANETLTLAVSIGSLFVAYLAYKTAADTSELRDAIATLTRLDVEAQRQVETMQEANRISSRALTKALSSAVYFGDLSLIGHLDSEGRPGMGIRMAVGNGGDSPTRALRVRMACTEAIWTLDEPFDQRRLAAAKEYRIAIGPKKEASYIACTYGVPAFTRVITDSRSIYVFGDALYADTVRPSQTHRVEFCYRFYRFFSIEGGPPTGDADACGRHNCTDDECDAEDAAAAAVARN
jgi:cell division protein FtsL